MIDRKRAVRFINNQMGHNFNCSREKGGKSSYGWQELRELMDVIYEGEPISDEERLIDKKHIKKP